MYLAQGPWEPCVAWETWAFARLGAGTKRALWPPGLCRDRFDESEQEETQRRGCRRAELQPWNVWNSGAHPSRHLVPRASYLVHGLEMEWNGMARHSMNATFDDSAPFGLGNWAWPVVRRRVSKRHRCVDMFLLAPAQASPQGDS